MNSKKEKYHIDNYLKNKSYIENRCVVDTENVFIYKNKKYRVNSDVKSYKVHNKPRKLSNGKWNDWTNECEMDCIYVIECNGKTHFFDQDYYRIHPSLITELHT